MSCTGAKPALGYSTMYEAAAALQSQGLKPCQIAARLGITRKNAYNLLDYAKNRGHRPPPVPVGIPAHVLVRLAPEARWRGLSTPDLARRLLSTIAREGLVGAVLDDERGSAA